jgi:glucokinase
MERIPTQLILYTEPGLMGAAWYANRLQKRGK